MFIAIWLIIWTNKLKVKDVIEWCVIGVVIVLLVYH